MTKHGSRENRPDDEQSRTAQTRRQTRNHDPSPYVAPHDGMGVYDHGERDPDSVYATADTATPTASTDTVETHSGGVANGLLQRRAKDERPADIDQTDVPEPVREVLSSPGRGMCGAVQRDIEAKMGESFGDVRVHTGGQAAQACEAINARAFTAGNHIVFNSGEYDPRTPHGKYVIAHEMAHVTQQTGGALSLLPQADSELVVDPDPALEREADEAAREALSEDDGENPRIQRLPDTSTDIHIQRIPEEKVFHALALFEGENEAGDVGDFRESQNQNRIGFLHQVAQDILEKGSKQEQSQTAKVDAALARAELDQSRSDADDSHPGLDDDRPLETLVDEPESLEQEITDLTAGISEDLEQVALIDDQREALKGEIDPSYWEELSWTVTKGLLGLKLGPLMIGVEVAEVTLRELWESTSGSLDERAQQIREQIANGEWLGDAGDDPTGVRE